MIYFSTKSNLKFMQEFSQSFEQLRQIEKNAQLVVTAKREQARRNRTEPIFTSTFEEIRKEAQLLDESYTDIRTKYTKMILRAIKVTNEERVSHQRQIQSAPIEGNTTFNGSIYSAILNPPSTLIDFDTDFRDTVNKVLGSLEWKKEKELSEIRNPLYWLKELLVFVIRLPYTLIQISGFDTKKVEEHFLGKLAQLLYVIALILLTARLGISITDAIQILISTSKP